MVRAGQSRMRPIALLHRAKDESSTVLGLDDDSRSVCFLCHMEQKPSILAP